MFDLAKEQTEYINIKKKKRKEKKSREQNRKRPTTRAWDGDERDRQGATATAR